MTKRLWTVLYAMILLLLIGGVLGLVFIYRSADRVPRGAKLVRGEGVEMCLRQPTDRMSFFECGQRSAALRVNWSR
jgi:hypothetical protein